MKDTYKLNNETKNVFNYIKSTLVNEYRPINKITLDYLILSILLNEECVAYKILSKIMLSDNIVSMISSYRIDLFAKSDNDIIDNNRQILFDDKYDTLCEESLKNFNVINTATLFITYFSLYDGKKLNEFGLTLEEYKNAYTDFKNDNNQHPKQVYSNLITPTPKNIGNKIKAIKLSNNGELDKLMLNITKLSSDGKVDMFIGGDRYYEKIFTSFGKSRKNNVLVIGEEGVGKTCLIKHIANLINEGRVPECFRNKQLYQLSTDIQPNNFLTFNNLYEQIRKNGECIIFIDDIHNAFIENMRFPDTSYEKLLNLLLTNNKILVIASTSYKNYKSIFNNKNTIKKDFQNLYLEKPSDKDMHEILLYHSKKIGKYHNVKYSDNILNNIYRLCKQYFSENKGCEIMIDVLDEIGSYKHMKVVEDETLKELNERLGEILEKKTLLSNDTTRCVIDDIDTLTKEEISIKSEINKRKKENFLNKKPQQVTMEDVKYIIAQRANLPITDIDLDEKIKLQKLYDNLKNEIIGQDEAIDVVTKVVQKKRLSISNPNKPSVLFFAGNTGTGKTYLAKMLAKNVYGDEKCIVRLDMSEYSDRTSTNKLYGSAPGYIGYDSGGILTEAVKKKKNCVLLLDEMEKANEDVFNVFLQLFDEGRLTDNTGEIVDFKNVIIIMTSNVGVKESMERGKQIGFNQQSDFSKNIIDKELKKRFKPEFLNRIDKIVFFNKLTEDNLLQIVKNEILKFKDRIVVLGYDLDETLTDTVLPNIILNNIKDKFEYGARPILREIQTELEDKITNYLLYNDVEQGFIFTYENINNI